MLHNLLVIWLPNAPPTPPHLPQLLQILTSCVSIILCIHERRSFDLPSDMRAYTLTSAAAYLNPIKLSSICLRSLSSSTSKMVFLPASKLFFLLIPICSFSVVSTARSSPGILVIGGDSYPHRSVEFWSPTNPEEGSCELSDYPRQMYDGPTANLVSERWSHCLLL